MFLLCFCVLKSVTCYRVVVVMFFSQACRCGRLGAPATLSFHRVLIVFLCFEIRNLLSSRCGHVFQPSLSLWTAWRACYFSPGNQPHQNRSTHHNHGTVWASQSLVTLCTFYRQILSLTYSFFLGNFRPRLARLYL